MKINEKEIMKIISYDKTHNFFPEYDLKLREENIQDSRKTNRMKISSMAGKW